MSDFEKVFPILSKASTHNTIFEDPLKAYKVEDWGSFEEDCEELSKLSSKELYERLQFLPHKEFYLELHNSSVMRLGCFDHKWVFTALHRNGSFSIVSDDMRNPHPDSTMVKLGTLNVWFYSGVDTGQGINPFKATTSVARDHVFKTLVCLMAVVNRIYSEPSEITVYEPSPLLIGPRPYKPVTDTETYIRTVWKSTHEYVNSNREGRRKIQARKREHEVSGHWRHLKSGKRVFVKAHKRGDSSIGKVISHTRIR